MTEWMIYGANGYTGELCAREAKRRGLTPVIAGRDRAAIERLGSELGLSTKVFSLNNADQIAAELNGLQLVLNCAGPFSGVCGPMIEGCAKSGVHYLDLSNEIDVFEYIHKEDARWREANIAVIAGMGFLVAVTDCFAAKLAGSIPDANRLELALRAPKRLSPGTAKEGVEHVTRGARHRVGGKIVAAPPGKCCRAAFADGETNCIAASSGEVSTVFFSTGIGDITYYSNVPETPRFVQRLFGVSWVKKAVKSIVGATLSGPDQTYRESTRSQLWARVANDKNIEASATLTGPEVYWFSVLAALGAVEQFLNKPPVPGALTPSMALGPEFIDNIEGVQIGPIA